MFDLAMIDLIVVSIDTCFSSHSFLFLLSIDISFLAFIHLLFQSIDIYS